MTIDQDQEIDEEDLYDLQAYIEAKKEPEGEAFPLELVKELTLGEGSKVKAVREYRGYTVTELAKKVGITESYLSQIENFKRNGSVKIYQKIAAALQVDIDMLI